MPRTLLFDRSDRTRLQFSGPHAVATLDGLVTNAVRALPPGRGAYAAALTAKGKMVTDLRIFMRAPGPLVDVSPRGSRGLREMFAKYVNPRFATVADVTQTLRDLGVFGGEAGSVVAAATGIAPDVLAGLAEYEHAEIGMGGHPVIVARVPDLGVEGYDLFADRAGVDTLHDALIAAGAVPGDARVWHTTRVAAGRPEWGVDMDENMLPQEANLEALHGVSYDKGCYIGQETVARIHFRGHVNRTLRRVVLDGDVEPPSGSALIDDAGKVVGDVRSTAVLTAGDARAVLGIGMVRREIEDGALLAVRWSAGETRVRVLGPATGNAEGATD